MLLNIDVYNGNPPLQVVLQACILMHYIKETSGFHVIACIYERINTVNGVMKGKCNGYVNIVF